MGKGHPQEWGERPGVPWWCQGTSGLNHQTGPSDWDSEPATMTAGNTPHHQQLSPSRSGTHTPTTPIVPETRSDSVGPFSRARLPVASHVLLGPRLLESGVKGRDHTIKIKQSKALFRLPTNYKLTDQGHLPQEATSHPGGRGLQAK